MLYSDTFAQDLGVALAGKTDRYPPCAGTADALDRLGGDTVNALLAGKQPVDCELMVAFEWRSAQRCGRRASRSVGSADGLTAPRRFDG